MARPTTHTIRHLVDDPFFIQCSDNLRDDRGNQVARIQNVVSIALEKRASNDPPKFNEALDQDGFGSVEVMDDPVSGFERDMIRGTVSIGDASLVPSAGDGYQIVAHCIITMLAPYGSGTARRDFVRPARIAAQLETAPAD